MLWEGFYHDFSTKKASAPWTPEVTSPPLTIYPGAAPTPTCSSHSGISLYETYVAGQESRCAIMKDTILW